MTTPTTPLRIRGLELSRPQGQILRGIDLELGDGELVAILGASGAGKTTVLRTIVALEPFDRGAIELDGVMLTPGPLPPESRLRELRKLLRQLTTGGKTVLIATHDLDFAAAFVSRTLKLQEGRLV